MLGGIAPVLIFSFPLSPKSATFNAIAGIPLIGETIAKNVGLPIPLYLDEKLTGLYVESETKAIDIDTVVQPRNDGGAPLVDQRGLNSLITVNMLASKDSILLSVLLALNDIVFSKVVSKEYNVSYLNGSTAIFGGLLHGFSTQNGSDDDLIRIVLQLSKANQQGTTPNNVVSVLPKITGAIPVAGGH
jgi:hypothetical protein